MHARRRAHDRARLEAGETERVDVDAPAHLRVRGQQDLKTTAQPKALDAVGAHTPANPVRCLKDDALDIHPPELLRADEARETAANYRHVDQACTIRKRRTEDP